MHICIPDTREVRPPSGGAYLLYNVHIDGLYHCSLRYKQLHHLHQALSKRFPAGNRDNVALPPFPPKRLLPLSQAQVEDRRQMLEKYLQNISQDKQISSSPLFNMYLLEAQRESSSAAVDANRHVHLDIELVNGQKVRLPIVGQDSVDSVLTACCRSLGLADQYHAYFCLCLCGYDVVSDKLIIKRRLSFFEAPYITLQMAIQQQEQLQSALAAAAASATHDSCQHLDHNHNHHHNNHSHGHHPPDGGSREHKCNHQQAHHTARPCPCCVPSPAGPSSAWTAPTAKVPAVSSSSDIVQQERLRQRLHGCACCNCHGCDCTGTSNANGNGNGNLELAACASVAPGAAERGHAGPSRSSFVTHRILLRKSYWDPLYDTHILSDSRALSLLFIQTVYDMKHSLMFVDRATYQRLESLLAADSKLDYILLARTLKYYNYVHFEPCYSDYPRPRTKVMISIGSKELNMRVLKQPHVASSAGASTATAAAASVTADHDQDQVLYCTSSLGPYRGPRQLVTRDDLIESEYTFKVPLIRCWRLTSLETLNSGANSAAPSASQVRHAHHQPSATTTLAGGKRKSLSLFNSVLGNSNSSSGGGGSTGASSSGTGGASLVAALRSRAPDTLGGGGSNNNNSASTPSRANGHTPCHGRPDSFHCFSSNANQTASSSNSSNTPNNNHSSGQLAGGQSCNSNNISSNSSTCCNTSHAQSLHQHQHQHHQHHHHHKHPQPGPHQEPSHLSQYELSFEYLVAKDTLRWVTISSDQAIFISISLQGVVDELVSKRETSLNLGAPHPAQSSLSGPSTSNGAASDSRRALSAAAVSRPIAIQSRSAQSRAASQQQQLAESFTYLCRDGGRKSIKAKSQQQLLERFCGNLAAGGPLSSSAPPASSSYALGPERARDQAEQQAATGATNGSLVPAGAAPPRRAPVVQAQTTGFWPGSSPPGRYYGHQSSSGTCGQAAGATVGGGLAAPFEFGHHYYCNTRRASNQNAKCKAPSPIINDAFEGVVSTDDDF